MIFFKFFTQWTCIYLLSPHPPAVLFSLCHLWSVCLFSETYQICSWFCPLRTAIPTDGPQCLVASYHQLTAWLLSPAQARQIPFVCGRIGRSQLRALFLRWNIFKLLSVRKKISSMHSKMHSQRLRNTRSRWFRRIKKK